MIPNASIGDLDQAIAALAYFHKDSPVRLAKYSEIQKLHHEQKASAAEIAIALKLPVAKVQSSLAEIDQAARAFADIDPPLRAIPWRFLTVLRLAQGHTPMRGPHGGSPLTLDFSTTEKIHAFFSTRPQPAPVPNLKVRGVAAIRAALKC